MSEDRKLGSEWDDDEIENQPSFLNEGKSLFLFTSTAGVFILLSFIILIWYLIYPRLQEIGFYIDIIAGVFFVILISGILLNHLLVLISALIEKDIIPFNLRNVLIESYLFLFSQKIGKVLNVSKDRIANSFVKVNNSLVRGMGYGRSKNKRLLLLLPRCMQDNNCNQMIIEDINNCKDCGKCDIKEIKRLGKLYGFYAHVATGGTLARKKVKEYKPSIILAVACERELVSGIGDTGHIIPVIGLPNRRDDGPCKNTRVDIKDVEDTIILIMSNNKKVKAVTDKDKIKITV